MNNQDNVVELKREEDYKYKKKGHCPRCDGLLSPAKAFYAELYYKNMLRCFSCCRIWDTHKETKELYLVH